MQSFGTSIVIAIATETCVSISAAVSGRQSTVCQASRAMLTFLPATRSCYARIRGGPTRSEIEDRPLSQRLTGWTVPCCSCEARQTQLLDFRRILTRKE